MGFFFPDWRQSINFGYGDKRLEGDSNGQRDVQARGALYPRSRFGPGGSWHIARFRLYPLLIGKLQEGRYTGRVFQ